MSDACAQYQRHHTGSQSAICCQVLRPTHVSAAQAYRRPTGVSVASSVRSLIYYTLTHLTHLTASGHILS
jgi:hypothetical protein